MAHPRKALAVARVPDAHAAREAGDVLVLGGVRQHSRLGGQRGAMRLRIRGNDGGRRGVSLAGHDRARAAGAEGARLVAADFARPTGSTRSAAAGGIS